MRRLKRRRLIPVKYRGLASVAGALLLLGGVYFVFTYIIGGGLLQGNALSSISATEEAAPAAASQAGPDGAASSGADAVSPLATPTIPPPAISVERGQLALIRADAEPLIMECARYRVLRGNELLGFGATDSAGVALAIPKRKVEVFCDGVRSEY